MGSTSIPSSRTPSCGRLRLFEQGWILLSASSAMTSPSSATAAGSQRTGGWSLWDDEGTITGEGPSGLRIRVYPAVVELTSLERFGAVERPDQGIHTALRRVFDGWWRRSVGAANWRSLVGWVRGH